MADDETDGGEVAQVVFEALAALKAIEDPAVRAREISAFLRESGKWVKELSDLRRDYVLGQRRQEVSFRAIAKELRVHPATVQDIVRGYSGSGSSRPRKKESADGEDAGASGNE
jgi:hypothetical protein